MNFRSNQIGLYYLRVGFGFITLWSAWDVIVHQQQIYAFFAAFPGIGMLSGHLMVAWFVVLLITGGMLLSGWYFREATAVMGVILLISLLVFSFMTPKVNAVLGPWRPLTLKSLVWFGGCLVLLTHPADPFNPERRNVQGYPDLAGKAQFIFRILLGTYCVWDGLLKAVNANDYMTLLSGAMIQIPFFPNNLADVFTVATYVLQLLAGLMILSGIKFRWAIVTLMLIALIQLIGTNWFVTKALLRAGGRFMMRDIVIVASCIYFWLAGPGAPILKIQVAGNSSENIPPNCEPSDQDIPPASLGQM